MQRAVYRASAPLFHMYKKKCSYLRLRMLVRKPKKKYQRTLAFFPQKANNISRLSRWLVGFAIPQVALLIQPLMMSTPWRLRIMEYSRIAEIPLEKIFRPNKRRLHQAYIKQDRPNRFEIRFQGLQTDINSPIVYAICLNIQCILFIFFAVLKETSLFSSNWG